MSNAQTLIDEPLRVGDVQEIPDELDASLRVVAGPDTGKVIHIEDPITFVGRDGECQLELDDPRVSTRHAMIYFAGGEFRVRDLDSTNGSLLKAAPSASSRSRTATTSGSASPSFASSSTSAASPWPARPCSTRSPARGRTCAISPTTTTLWRR